MRKGLEVPQKGRKQLALMGNKWGGGVEIKKTMRNNYIVALFACQYNIISSSRKKKTAIIKE